MADAITSYLNSDDLIEAVKRKISLPVAQNTFTTDDILRFLNEELLLSQVPSVLSYHEEYYDFEIATPLRDNVAKYKIPDRAIGMKLRDLFWKDDQGNYFEMTRIDTDDKAFFQRNIGSNQAIHKYYLEGNDVVLTPSILVAPTGNLAFTIFIRPNSLVDLTRASTIDTIQEKQSIIVKNTMPAGINTGTDTITITSHGFNLNDKLLVSTTGLNIPSPLLTTTYYYVINPTTNTFQLALTAGGSAINLTSQGDGVLIFTRNRILTFSFAPGDIDLTNNTITITEHGFAENEKAVLSSSGELPDELSVNRIYYIVNVTANTFQLTFTSAGTPIDLLSIGNGVHQITVDICELTMTDAIPDNIIDETLIDFLETLGGHRILGIDKIIPMGGISGSTLYIEQTSIPDNLSEGDYICKAKECIIPYLPDDLHSGLAERTGARINASQGDQQGLEISNAKIADIAKAENVLLDSRVEGSPQKVNPVKSLLRYGRMGVRRRV